MKNNVEVWYCSTSYSYFIIDKSPSSDSSYTVGCVNINKSGCRNDTLIRDNLTSKEANDFVLTINKLKGK